MRRKARAARNLCFASCYCSFILGAEGFDLLVAAGKLRYELGFLSLRDWTPEIHGASRWFSSSEPCRIGRQPGLDHSPVRRVGRFLEVAKPDRWADDVTPSDIEPVPLQRLRQTRQRGSGRFQLEPKFGGGDRLSVNDKPRRRLYLGNAIDLPPFNCYRGPAPSAIRETTSSAVSRESLPRPDFTSRQLQIFCFGCG